MLKQLLSLHRHRWWKFKLSTQSICVHTKKKNYRFITDRNYRNFLTSWNSWVFQNIFSLFLVVFYLDVFSSNECMEILSSAPATHLDAQSAVKRLWLLESVVTSWPTVVVIKCCSDIFVFVKKFIFPTFWKQVVDIPSFQKNQKFLFLILFQSYLIYHT